MPYSQPTNLGIVACPGGQAFASEVIAHLRHMYKHRFNLKRDVISKRYNVEKEELVKDINFYNDLQTSDLCVKLSFLHKIETRARLMFLYEISFNRASSE